MSSNCSCAEIASLTSFRRQLLFVTRQLDGRPCGIEVADAVGDLRNEEVTVGRLYGNLGELTERDLLEKDAHDGRTDAYAVPEDTATALDAYVDAVTEGV